MRSKREPRRTESAPVSTTNAVRAAPAWLTPRALEIWERLAPTLTLAKLLTPADELAFARYCRNFGDWLQLRDALDAEGFTYEAESYAAGKSGDEGKTTTLRRLDPRFLVSDRLERQLLAAEDRFGLNPSERQRIMVARNATGYGGGLFDEPPAGAAQAVPASRPASPASSPVGLLTH